MSLPTTDRKLSPCDRLLGIVGEEQKDALRTGVTGHSQLKIGVVDVVAKTMAYYLIAPALALPEQSRLICREGSFVGAVGSA